MDKTVAAVGIARAPAGAVDVRAVAGSLAHRQRLRVLGGKIGAFLFLFVLQVKEYSLPGEARGHEAHFGTTARGARGAGRDGSDAGREGEEG
jgi:hypothetical protein